MSSGALGADQEDGQPRETGGAPEARAGNAPALVTEAGDLEADPGGLLLLLLSDGWFIQEVKLFEILMKNVFTERGRKMSQAGGDPKRHQKATARPDGHVVVVGKGFFCCCCWVYCVKTYPHTFILQPLDVLRQAA